MANQDSMKRARTLEEMNVLMARTNEGDRSVIPALRAYLRDHPAIWTQLGDMAMQSQAALVDATAGKNEITRDAVLNRIHDLKLELNGSSPTPLERLLVDRIIVGWMHVHQADLVLLGNGESRTLTQGDYLRRRLDSAQRRYLSAMHALAVVRRLQVPALQLNIADQQVNVAGGGPLGPPLRTEVRRPE